MDNIVERYIAILELLATNPNDYFGRTEAKILLSEIKALGSSDVAKYSKCISILEQISQDKTVEGIDYTLELDSKKDVGGKNFDEFIDQLINFFAKQIAKKTLDAFNSKDKKESKVVIKEKDFEKFFDISVPAPKAFKSNEVYFTNKLNNNDCFAYDAFEGSIKFIPQYYSVLNFYSGKSTKKDFVTYGVEIKDDTWFMQVIDKVNDYLKAKKVKVDIYFYRFLRHLFDAKGLHTINKKMFGGIEHYYSIDEVRRLYNGANRFFKNTYDTIELYTSSSSNSYRELNHIYRNTDIDSFVGTELKIEFYLEIVCVI